MIGFQSKMLGGVSPSRLTEQVRIAFVGYALRYKRTLPPLINETFIEDECRRRWKAIRDKYRRELDRLGTLARSGSGQNLDKAWDMMPLLQFLSPFTATRRLALSLVGFKFSSSIHDYSLLCTAHHPTWRHTSR